MSVEQLVSAVASCSNTTAWSLTQAEQCSTVAAQLAGIWPQEVSLPGPATLASSLQLASVAEHAACICSFVGELVDATNTIALYLQPVDLLMAAAT